MVLCTVSLTFFSFPLYYIDHVIFNTTIRTKQESMVLADMLLKPGEAWEYCPRETLRRVTNVLKDEFDLVQISIYPFLRSLWIFLLVHLVA